MEVQKKENAKEKIIFDAIAQGDLAEFDNFLAQHKGSVDLYDENGMTALQHAAYKGNKEMVQTLLDRVSNTNCFLPHVRVLTCILAAIACWLALLIHCNEYVHTYLLDTD